MGIKTPTMEPSDVLLDNGASATKNVAEDHPADLKIHLIASNAETFSRQIKIQFGKNTEVES